MKIAHRDPSRLAGWLVFLFSLLVYYWSAERSGSLWDCGEFILGAYKLQVVHPPGAPLYLLLGRVAAMFGDLFSAQPSAIAFAVNLFSGICTAGAAMLVAWTTMILARLAVARAAVEGPEQLMILGAGVVAGLTTAFSSSIWFSAVEGEVYGLSTFFTALTVWAAVKWYSLPDRPQHDRWLVFALYAIGLSIGVHLLSLLTLPALAVLYYLKRRKNHHLIGMLKAFVIGALLIGAVQFLVISGIPALWAKLELLMVNGLGFPFHSGLVPLALILAGILLLGFRYAHRLRNPLLQTVMVTLTLLIASYSMVGVVVIRANADTPVNMNRPSDAHRLVPYVNRDQYGERPLLKGPHFDAVPIRSTSADKWGQVGDRYEKVDQKISYVYKASDQSWFPRMGHSDARRRQLYRLWMGKEQGPPTMADNLSFFWRYQVKWMYWRYFMWNFAGRQNGDQGFMPMDLRSGHWISGIPWLDKLLVHDMSELPDTWRQDKGRNRYFLLPFLLGVLGLIFHLRRGRGEAVALLALFFMTGLGIILYSNQPPSEPRERDYVLVGSFFTFCIWIGLGSVALWKLLSRWLSSRRMAPVAISGAMIIPLLLLTQNFDDHSRRHLSGARDFASNYLESCAPNAILFTYADNETYPLWYAQEVEGIRTDVRVVNLNLLAADWYIDSTRRKVNESPALKLSISRKAYQGPQRQVLSFPRGHPDQPMTLQAALRFVGADHPLPRSGNRQTASYLPSRQLFLAIDKNRAVQTGLVPAEQVHRVVDQIPIRLDAGRLLKHELAVLDIVESNLYERPIYFSATRGDANLHGLQDYLRSEGLVQRLVPVKTTQSPSVSRTADPAGIDAARIYELVMKKFRWGGFDRRDIFVSSTMKAFVQRHRTMMEQAARQLLSQGQMDQAMELVDKYFDVFPHRNVPYDTSILSLLQIYVRAGERARLQKHMQILADETEDKLRFYDSLPARQLNQGFGGDQQRDRQAAEIMLRFAQAVGDEAGLQALQARFAPYLAESEAD